jgi:hypothetical protein
MTAAYLRRALFNPGIYAAVLLTFVLVVVAYQVRPAYNIPIGTATDGPLLKSFHDPESPPKGSDAPYHTYRWSKGSDSSITFQDVGRQDFDVVLSVNGSRPPGQPAPRLTITTAGVTLLDVSPPLDVQEYSFKVPRELAGDGSFSLDLHTNSFKPQGDARELGIIVTGVKLAPSANPDRFIEPPAGPLAAIIGAVAILALLLAVAGWGAGGVLLGSGAVGLMASSLLVFDRLWITSRQWYWSWPLSLIVGGLVMVLCWAVGGWLLERGGVRWSALQRRALLTIVMLVLAIRLAGQLHPSIFVFDLGFHVNILLRVSTGDWLFKTQPAELGGFGHSTFYLPTPYIFVQPISWLLGDMRMAIRLFTVAIGTLGALPIYYLATRASGSGRAGIIASLLYLTMPISVLIFSWGITSNIFGEFFALCSLAVAVGGYDKLSPKRPVFWILVGLLTITMLSHPGVLSLTAVAILGAALMWWIGRRYLGGWRAAAGLVGAFASATVVAVAVYYWHFIPDMVETLKQIQEERATGTGAGGVPLIVGGSVNDPRLGLVQREVYSFGEWLRLGLWGFWNEAQAYYRVWPLAGAMVGYSFLFVRARTWGGQKRERARALLLATLGWVLSIIFFALVGWATNLFVRYPLFALPVIAIGCGLLLSALWVRRKWGQGLALLVVVFFAVEALAFWQYRINFAFK